MVIKTNNIDTSKIILKTITRCLRVHGEHRPTPTTCQLQPWRQSHRAEEPHQAGGARAEEAYGAKYDIPYMKYNLYTCHIDFDQQ